MRLLYPFAAWLLATAALAAPTLSVHTEGGVTLSAPEGWKVLIKPDAHNAVASKDSTTHVHVHWWPFKEGASADKILDKLVKVTNDNLPFGSITEDRRYDVPDGRVAEGSFGTLGYTMRLGFLVTVTPDAGTIRGAILLTSPEGWEDLGGVALLQSVAGSLSVPGAAATAAAPATP